MYVKAKGTPVSLMSDLHNLSYYTQETSLGMKQVYLKPKIYNLNSNFPVKISISSCDPRIRTRHGCLSRQVPKLLSHPLLNSNCYQDLKPKYHAQFSPLLLFAQLPIISHLQRLLLFSFFALQLLPITIKQYSTFMEHFLWARHKSKYLT